MSRSLKKVPIAGNGGDSDKIGKRKANRALRKNVNQVDFENEDLDILPHLREVSNVYSFPKDGKKFIKNSKPKDLRK